MPNLFGTVFIVPAAHHLTTCAWLLQEFELAKVRQDRQLEGIERGLGTLREVGLAMGEALDHQDILVDAITEKVVVRQRFHAFCHEHLWSKTWSPPTLSMTSCLPLLRLQNKQGSARHPGGGILCCMPDDSVVVAQVDDVTKQLKTNNMKLKGLVTQVQEYAVVLTHWLCLVLTAV